MSETSQDSKPHVRKTRVGVVISGGNVGADRFAELVSS